MHQNTATRCAFRELFCRWSTKVTVNLPLRSLSVDDHSLSMCWAYYCRCTLCIGPALKCNLRSTCNAHKCLRISMCGRRSQCERHSKEPLIAPILRRSVNNFWVATLATLHLFIMDSKQTEQKNENRTEKQKCANRKSNSKTKKKKPKTKTTTKKDPLVAISLICICINTRNCYNFVSN